MRWLNGFVNRRILAALLIIGSMLAAVPPGIAAEAGVPSGLSNPDWTSIRAAYEADRHAVRLDETGERFARNPGQQWQTRFDGRGFTITPDAGAWTWGLELSGYGFAGAESRAIGDPVVSHRQGVVQYHWAPALQEWFVNDNRGLQQGWTISKRPAPGHEGEPLRLELAVRGGLQPQVSADGGSVSFVATDGARVLNFDGLKAWDADGQMLAARFERSGDNALRVAVNERTARYPITIDPIAQQAYIKASNTGTNDRFGTVVAVSGDTVVVGAGGEDSDATGVNGPNNNNADLSGAAYVFVRNGSTWTQQAYLKASNTGIFDGFGNSVSISGDTIVVGSAGEDSSATGVNGNQGDNSLLNPGAAYVFVRNGTTWTQQAYLKASNTQADDNFAVAAAVSGDTIVVGAYREDSDATGVGGNQSSDGASESGAAYIFVRNGTTWTQQAYLKASDTAANDHFGNSVAISGDTVAVGANGEDSSATGVNADQSGNGAIESGAAYIFVRNGTTWTQQASLKASNTGEQDLFGSAIAAAGDTVLVGATGESSDANTVNGNQADNSALWAGAGYVFVRNGTTWTQQAYLKASNSEQLDAFGNSVSLSGDSALVGAYREDSNAVGVGGIQSNNSADGSGAAYLFARNGSSWTQQAYLKASNTGQGDNFGISVGVSGATLVVGADSESSNATGVGGDQSNNNALSSGAVYAFAVPLTLTVRDADRFGDPAAGLAGISVTLLLGAQVIDTVTSDAQGSFSFGDTVNLSQPYTLRLEGFGLQRAYESVVPSSLGATPLVLPVDLHALIDSELVRLETTDIQVEKYDTVNARALLSDWSSAQPATAAVHAARDHALGRLLVASKGLADLYSGSHPLNLASAHHSVDLAASSLTAGRLFVDLREAARQRASVLVAQGGATQPEADFADAGVFTAAVLGAKYLQALLDFKSLLPEWSRDQVGTGIALTAVDVLGAFHSTAWADVAGREDLLASVVTGLTGDVGAAVIGSAYVEQTQSDLDLATARAAALEGVGTVNDGFVASQQLLAAVLQRNGDQALVSEAVGSTREGWRLATLFTQMNDTPSGLFPASDIIAATGSFVISMNLAGLVQLGVDDYSTVSATAFNDAPIVAGRAFDPTLPQPIGPAMNTTTRSARPKGVVPSEYSTLLAALRDRLVANDRPGVFSQAEALITADAVLEAAIESELLPLLALTAANENAPLATAHRVTLARAGVFGGERMTLYGLLAGYVIPNFANPATTDADLIARIDDVSMAMTIFEASVADTQAAAAGLTAPSHVLVPEHGLSNSNAPTQTPPGTILVRARLVNAGQQPATGVVVSLSFGASQGPVPVALLSSPSIVDLQTIPAGETRIVTWTAIATDTSAAGTGSAATYHIEVGASSGTADDADGSFEVLTALDLVFDDSFEAPPL